MNSSNFIVLLILGSLISCSQPPDDIDPLIVVKEPVQTKATLSGRYKTKPPKELFFTDRMLILNTDSTFSYTCWTCIGIDTCYGSWKLSNSMITLKTSKELRKEIDQRTMLDRVRLVDLNNHSVLIKPNYLLLQTYGNQVDTLIKE